MARTAKPIIGLAGGIGSGKSTVARLLADLGCIVADSDAASRAALSDPAIRERIVREWGERVLDENGEINRSALAAIVFGPGGGDQHQRRLLESIIHPWVEQRRREQFAPGRALPDAPAFVIDAPLLFEAGLDRECDAVIFVDAPRNVRLERVSQSRGWDERELARREESQLPLDEKRSRADHVISNTGSVAELAEQVRRMLATIVTTRTDRQPAG